MLVNVRDPQPWTYLRNLKEKKRKMVGEGGSSRKFTRIVGPMSHLFT
jgi:hypothetical protein